jgi:hypothetical protein
MPRKRKRRPAARPQSLSIRQILAWADEFHERTGGWPAQKSGRIPGSLGENWKKVNHALSIGLRGLPGGSSIAQLLAEHRGVRNRKRLPLLSEDLIVDWARAHHRRTGEWPTQYSGPIPEAPGENWKKMQAALIDGRRSLPGGSSLARLLADRCGVRNRGDLPRLTLAAILRWADAHRERTGAWPRHDTGPVADAPGETWLGIESALRDAVRGLPGGSTLARLLQERRGVRNNAALPRLTRQAILAWCDAFHERTGRWPGQYSGPVADAPGETWGGIQRALTAGLRGLPGGSSLVKLLAEERGGANRGDKENGEIGFSSDGERHSKGHSKGSDLERFPVDGTGEATDAD